MLLILMLMRKYLDQLTHYSIIQVFVIVNMIQVDDHFFFIPTTSVRKLTSKKRRKTLRLRQRN